MKRLLRHPAVLGTVAGLLAAYLRFALGTTRWVLHGEDELGRLIHANPAVFAFWHERLPLMPALWMWALRARRGGRRGRMFVLVSRHQDGRMIGAAMRGFGLDVLHGSSAKRGEQKGGAAGLRAMLGVLADGNQVVITPDGPRGPRRVLARGVAQLGALAGVPVVPCAAQAGWRIVLPTWDRLVIPLPFGRGVLVCGTPVLVARDGWADSVPGLQAALTAAAERADALCRV